MKKTAIGLLVICMVVVLVLKAAPAYAEEQKITATVQSTKVAVGKSVSIYCNIEGVTYISSDLSIAYVSEDGKITGKKPGKVDIYLSKENYRGAVFHMTVDTTDAYKAFGEVPIPVVMGELELTSKYESKIYGYRFSHVFRNHTNFIINDITLTYQSIYEVDGEGRVVVEAEAIMKKLPANDVNYVAVKDYEPVGEAVGIKPIMIKYRIGELLITYDYTKNLYTQEWSGMDLTAPDIYFAFDRTYYIGDIIDYTRDVKVDDNRDVNPTLTVDSEKVNLNKQGDYKVTYTAQDASGNKSNKTVTFHILANKPARYVPIDKVYEVADQILAKIITEDMTAEQKARQIYRYIRENVSYVNSTDKSDWVQAAYRGLTRKNGDCFIYYATSQMLLTRANIPNVMIEKKPGITKNRVHFWNIVLVESGWYHYDTCPRTSGGFFCLLTDAQLKDYIKEHGTGTSHVWDETIDYPERSEKTITSGYWNYE